MKKIFVGSSALVVVALATVFLSSGKAVAASSADENSVVALKKEIARLRAENSALRKEVGQHTATRERAVAPAPEKAMAMATKAPVAPPAAPLGASGYFEAYVGGAWSEDSLQNAGLVDDWKYNGWSLGGAGRGNWWATPNISVQFDVQVEGTNYKIPNGQLFSALSSNFSTLSYLVGGHVNLRDPQTGLLGLFGGIGDAGGNSGSQAAHNDGVRHGTVGLEGQYYLDALTLYGQGGYTSTLITGNGTFFNKVHEWYLRGTGRYFLQPNLMIEGTAEYAKGGLDYSSFDGIPSVDIDTWLWRAKAEWQPGAAPFSLFAAYEGSRTRYGNNVALGTTSERMADNRVMAGFRLYMRQDTLLANDRTGATLDVIDPLSTPTSPVMIFPTGQNIFISDARLKRDIALVGRLGDGLGLYRYRYLWSDTVYVGVMAQEVALIHPEAVVHGFDGYLRVDYGRLGLHLMTLPEWNERSEAARL